ncbi:MAG: hypothetical protein PUF12_09570 [Thermoflexaceae bacterium]|nr:hypothetical protein [Thermoflexaceae bacterium]
MSSQTKIIVLKQKNLIYGAFIAIVCIILILALIFMLPGQKDTSQPENNVSQYTAGVYYTSVVLNGKPVEIKVNIDDNLNNHITAVNVSDSVETMFPLFDSCLDEIVTQVIENNSTQNVTYSSENKYTSIILIEAIDNAIAKARK